MLGYSDTIAVEQERNGYASTGRDDVIKAIRTALKRRSGKSWSVTGGRGTGWGWIHIDAPPARRTAVHIKNPDYDEKRHGAPDNPMYLLVDTGERQEFGYSTPEDQRELCALLGLERMHHQGISIASSTGHYIEYVNRAEGRNPSTYGVQYWD